MDSRGYGTSSLRANPILSSNGNLSVTCGKLKIHQMPMRLLILAISKISYILYNSSSARVRALGRHHSICMLDVQTLGIISSACISTCWRGKILFE